MFGFLKNNVNPIGLDIEEDIVKVAQLKDEAQGVALVAGGSEVRPENIEPATANWQRWAIDAVRRVLEASKFQGKHAVATIPASDVVIDYVRASIPKGISDEKLNDLLLPKVKAKLPFDVSNAIIKYVPAEDDNIVVLATERQKIEIHLAIYERTPLQVGSIAVWPLAIASCYAKFFGRRKNDLNSVVMLVDVGPKNVNVVISRHKNLLFARSLAFGVEELNNDETTSKLTLELNACRRFFSSMYRSGQIDRLIFFSGNAVNRDAFAKIAKQMELPAQMGDCLAATKIENPWNCKLEKRGCKESWATAFGLGLS